MTRQEQSACDILDAVEHLLTHVAFCKAHWPLARPGDTYQDAGRPCTMPHAHKIRPNRMLELYYECIAITDSMVGE